MVGITAERGGASQQSGEFVNLYDVLQVPANADGETIRQQINKMYLEAQQNLDHRNAKKRLRYQQLFQVYLPQARFYLLDVERRQQYDRALSLPPTQTADETPAPDTQVNLAIREELWKQWQDSLVEEESDSSADGASTHHVVTGTSRVARSVPGASGSSAAGISAAPSTPVRRSWTAEVSGEEQQRAAEEARRLQLQRLEEQRLRDEQEKKDATMLMWRNRLIKGLVIIVVGTIGLSVFKSQTGVTPFEYVQQAVEKAGEEPKGEKELQQ